MSIKQHKLYELYLAYLETKKFNFGQLRLAQISYSLFEEFEMRLENDPHFSNEMNSLYLDLRRRNMISEILEYNTKLKFDV
jgi:hypothetical protein